jgi:hypothetical protein
MLRSMDRWARVVAIGRAQSGVVAVRQVLAAGVPRSTFDARVRRERWERPFPGVVVLPGRDLDAEVVTRAAALCVGPSASITGRSALAMHGVCDVYPVRVHLVVPRPHRARELAGVRVVQTRTLEAADRGPDRGVAVTTVPRALLDAAGTAGREGLRGWLIDARQRRAADVADVTARAVRAVSAPGRGRLLRACADVDASAADSVLVAEVEYRLRALGFHLDVPARTVAVPDRRLHPDLTVRDVPIAVEVDGFGTHASRRALDLDQRKHNAYVLAGWVVLRISWRRMACDWEGFVAELRTAVARHRPSAAP